MINVLMDNLAKPLWDLAISNGFWFSAAFLKGESNYRAEFVGRIFSDMLDWTIPMAIFRKITKCLGIPSIDRFASRLTA